MQRRMRWTLVAALAGVALSLPVGCDDDEEETGGESGETTAESGGGASGEGGGGGDAASDDLRTHLDLVELA